MFKAAPAKQGATHHLFHGQIFARRTYWLPIASQICFDWTDQVMDWTLQWPTGIYPWKTERICRLKAAGQLLCCRCLFLQTLLVDLRLFGNPHQLSNVIHIPYCQEKNLMVIGEFLIITASLPTWPYLFVVWFLRNHLWFRPTPAKVLETCRKYHACHADEKLFGPQNVPEVPHLPRETDIAQTWPAGNSPS